MVKHLITVCKVSASKLADLAGVVLLDERWVDSRARPFILACLQCCGDVIKYLVSERECDPNKEWGWKFGCWKTSPVGVAALKGNVELVKYIVELCEACFQPLWYSSTEESVEEVVIRDPEVVRFLMRHANVQGGRWSDVRELVMMSSVCSGLTDCVQYLLDNNIVDLNSGLIAHGNPYIDKAACNGHYDVVRYLVEKRADSYHCRVSASTVYAAASSGHLPLIEYLARKYVRCTYCLKDWQKSALYVAAGCGHLNIVNYLITKYNLTLNESIVFIPATRFLSPKVTARHGGHFPDEHEIILHVVAERGHLNMVKYLINQWNHDPDKSNTYSQTALHFAAFNEQLPVVEYLLSTGCPISPDTDGNTPLHFACWQGNLSVVKCLIEQCQLDLRMRSRFSQSPLCLAIEGGHLAVVDFLVDKLPTVEPGKPMDDKENTALHFAAYGGHINMVEYVIEKWVTYPNQSNEDSLTPLHVAVSRGNLHAAEYLVKEFPGVVTCKDGAIDKDGNTALHVAVKHGSPLVIKYLINECKISLNKTNKSLLTPLHVACVSGRIGMAEYLIKDFPGIVQCTDAPVDRHGNTALHVAVKCCSMIVIKYLINECKLSLNKPNRRSITPFHIACISERTSVAEYLIEDYSDIVTCTDAPVDDEGNSALHVAVKHGSLMIIKYLINDCKLDPYKSNCDSITPLYVALCEGNLSVVKCLYSECPSVIPGAPVNDQGNTALHVVTECGHLDLVKFFVKECKLGPEQHNKSLSTPLHLAVAHNRLSVIIYFLEEGLCPVSSVNYSKCLSSASRETLLFLTTEYDVKGKFSESVSQSSVKRYVRFCGGIKSSFPVHSFTKLFVLGDPAAGKSTLAKNFQYLASSFFPSFFGQVSGVESHTAGIIPVTIQSKKLGNLVVYDLAGHREFYSSHMAIMHKVMQEHPAIFMCVTDLSKSDEKIKINLRFWFNFIKMSASGVMACSQIVVVGSHADLLSKDDNTHKQNLVENMSQVLLSASFGGLATLDCRKLSSPGLTSLIALISKAQEAIQEKVQCATKVSIPIFCHMLMKFLSDLKVQKDVNVVYPLTDFSRMIRKENEQIARESAVVFIPSSTTELDHFLTILNDRGLVLYFRGSTDDDSWIVVDDDALLSQVNGVIIAPKDFKEHGFVTSNTGIATSSHITKLFPKFPPKVIIGVLESLEFCHEIDPSHLKISNLSLECSQDEFRCSLQEGERLLFFPSHISIDRNVKLWEKLRFCWYLECQDSDQFLPTRYLQLLILNLASFSFKRYSNDPWQVDERMCTVWKNGIQWRSKNGIETVVEVLDHCTAVQLLVTCPRGMLLEYCRHCSMIIREILILKQELCPSCALQEVLVPPSCLQEAQYPLPPLSQLPQLNIKHVAQCALEKSECSIFIDTFEPYQYLGESLIQSLFTKGSVKVSAPDLLEFAAALEISLKSRKDACKVLGIFFMVLENKVSEMPSGERENPVRVYLEMFVLWQAYEADGGTYKSLKERFDIFSISAGRNPLELAEIEKYSHSPSSYDSQQHSQPCQQ